MFPTRGGDSLKALLLSIRTCVALGRVLQSQHRSSSESRNIEELLRGELGHTGRNHLGDRRSSGCLLLRAFLP